MPEFDGQLEQEHARYRKALEYIAQAHRFPVHHVKGADDPYWRTRQDLTETARRALVCRCGMCRECYRMEEAREDARIAMADYRRQKEGD